MAKSKKRGGAKAHRKRVSARNLQIKENKRSVEKYQKDQFNELIKQYETQQKLNKDNTIPDVNQIQGVDGPEI